MPMSLAISHLLFLLYFWECFELFLKIKILLGFLIDIFIVIIITSRDNSLHIAAVHPVSISFKPLLVFFVRAFSFRLLWSLYITLREIFLMMSVVKYLICQWLLFIIFFVNFFITFFATFLLRMPIFEIFKTDFQHFQRLIKLLFLLGRNCRFFPSLISLEIFLRRDKWLMWSITHKAMLIWMQMRVRTILLIQIVCFIVHDHWVF